MLIIKRLPPDYVSDNIALPTVGNLQNIITVRWLQKFSIKNHSQSRVQNFADLPPPPPNPPMTQAVRVHTDPEFKS